MSNGNEREQQDQVRRRIIQWFAYANALLVLVEWLLLSDPTTFLGAPWNWGLTLFIGQLVYMGMSLQAVGPTEIGAVLFFGKPIYPTESGLVLVPWLVCSLFKETRLIIQIVVGSPQTNREDKLIEAESITKKEEGYIVLREDEPFRVTFADINDLENATAAERSSKNPLHRTITADPLMILTFQIGGMAGILPYLTHIGSLDQLRTITSQTAKGVLQRFAGQNTLLRTQLTLDHITSEITKALEYRLGERRDPPEGMHPMDEENRPNCGVNIHGVQIPTLGIDHETNKSIRDQVKAALDANATAKRSEGDAKRIENIGRADGRAERDRLRGKAEGLKAMAEATGNEAGARVLATEALQRAVEKGNVTILPTDSGLLTDVVRAATAVRATPPPKPPRRQSP